MKKNKKFIKYFLIIAIIIIGILPVMDFSQYVMKYDHTKLFNTDKIEQYANYSFYKLLNKSLVKEKVIVGKDDFLFLGNGYDNVLYKTQGLYPYKHKAIDDWTNKLKNIQTWYEDKGIKFAMVIAPNKHTVYNDKLPNWINGNKEIMTDDIVKLSLEKGINILDMGKKLKEQKATQLYLTTDSHWNQKGASIAYEETIKYINSTYGLKYKIPKYDLSMHHRKSGDLAALLKIKSILPNNYEKDYSFNFENESKVCHGYIDQNHKLKKCVNKKNPVMIITRQDQYMTNEHSLNKDSLLLVCDSFASANSKLYNATFSTIWKFHHNRIYGENLAKFVDIHKPDIVIYQLIEREFYDDSIVMKFSQDIKVLNSKHNSEAKNTIFNIHNPQDIHYIKQGFSISDKELIATNGDPQIILNKLKTNSKFVRLNYSLDSLVDTNFQLFYREKKQDAYSKYNSYSVVIKKGMNTISLSLPAKYINNGLRVDLVSKKGTYKIEEFSIYEIK